MISTVQALQQQAASLLLYQSVLENEVGQTFLTLLEAIANPNPSNNPSSNLPCLRAYGQWFKALATADLSWPDFLLQQIFRADNPFTQRVQTLEPVSDALIAAAQQDLRSLQQLYYCDVRQISQWVQTAAALPSAPAVWDLGQQTTLPVEALFKSTADWATALDSLIAHYRQAGTGLLASYRAFRWQSGQLVGIAYPDPIRIQALTGYEWQKAALTQNTEALLAGYPALHVLLYGSRGSGKSSLVKGLLHEYGDRGLRLIEVTQAELQELPLIADRLRAAPQKFIIFVDDLSFEEDEAAYKALKVVLEGNLTARPQNIAVYATSNRRHLIREFFGDRPAPQNGNEIQAWDTVQEKLSLSDRFGLTLTFEPADQATYLGIVRHLAQQAAIVLDPQDLEDRALQWATRHNGRSGRTARQFIDFLQAELGKSGLSATSLRP